MSESADIADNKGESKPADVTTDKLKREGEILVEAVVSSVAPSEFASLSQSPTMIDKQDENVGKDTLSGTDTCTKTSTSLTKKLFMTRKKPSIRAKERRVRQNRRLKKSLVPKNAVMALHEVKGISMGDFQVYSGSGGGFTVSVIINNTQYEGQGCSKNAAKNDACEKALRDIIILRMNQNKEKSKTEDSPITPGSSADDNAQDADQDMKDFEDNDNDIPMINLASFALYKLFTDWENKGFSIPLLPGAENGGENGSADKQKKDINFRTELPENWSSLHPATLLCHMRPGVSYINLDPEGEKPNFIQRVSITVDSQQFIGLGRSKKCARKNAAINACNAIFGTHFSPEKYMTNVPLI